VAVAQYVTPYEVVTKVLLVPQAVLGVLFPAFAAAFVHDRRRAAVLFDRGIRITALLTAPILLIITAFAHEGLSIWIGLEFARESTAVLQLLAVGVFVNGAVGQPAFTLVQGAGRPDLTAKLHLLELPLYALAMWSFARIFGLPGVALTWTLRVSFDALVLSYLAGRSVPLSRFEIQRVSAMICIALIAFAGGVLLHGVEGKALYTAVALVAFVVGGWLLGFGRDERESIVGWLRARERGPIVRPVGVE
jgi:O-antigen/teichoic acid export membrane protein